MDIPAGALERYTKPRSKARNPRDEQVDNFLERINASRKAAKVCEMSRGTLLRLLKGIPTENLYALYQECLKGERFEGLLKWKLKQRKV